MALRLYNTMGRKIEEFVPIHKGFVGFYGCGRPSTTTRTSETSAPTSFLTRLTARSLSSDTTKST